MNMFESAVCRLSLNVLVLDSVAIMSAICVGRVAQMLCISCHDLRVSLAVISVVEVVMDGCCHGYQAWLPR